MIGGEESLPISSVGGDYPGFMVELSGKGQLEGVLFRKAVMTCEDRPSLFF